MFHWSIWLGIAILIGSFVAAIIYNLITLKDKEDEKK
jgi:hypothetical protein